MYIGALNITPGGRAGIARDKAEIRDRARKDLKKFGIDDESGWFAKALDRGSWRSQPYL